MTLASLPIGVARLGSITRGGEYNAGRSRHSRRRSHHYQPRPPFSLSSLSSRISTAASPSSSSSSSSCVAALPTVTMPWRGSGDLTQALRSFLRNRDYCHPAKYELEFVLNVLRTKINIPHLHQIESFATKGEKNQCLEPQPNESAAATRTRSVLQARMKVCCGLAALAAVSRTVALYWQNRSPEL
jgi:hypothetical protein